MGNFFPYLFLQFEPLDPFRNFLGLGPIPPERSKIFLGTADVENWLFSAIFIENCYFMMWTR